MRLISTLCDSRAEALKILGEVPEDSLVLLPENVSFLSRTIRQISIKKNLFIIFNNDVVLDGKTYIAMRAIDKGEYQWTVRKFKPWHTDLKAGYSASSPEPIVKIRRIKSAVYICYDSCEIFKMYQMLNQEQIKLLLLTANWSFNFPLIERIIDFSLEYITSLEAVMFSNSNTISLIKTRTQKKRVTEAGYVIIEI
jgi:predicted amidohydrolase